MTNCEKYKTAEERASAFDKFCESYCECVGCPVRHGNACEFAWLELEDKKETPASCPWCGGEATVCNGYSSNGHSSWWVVCRCETCKSSGPFSDTEDGAVSAWNKVAEAMKKEEPK